MPCNNNFLGGTDLTDRELTRRKLLNILACVLLILAVALLVLTFLMQINDVSSAYDEVLERLAEFEAAVADNSGLCYSRYGIPHADSRGCEFCRYDIAYDDKVLLGQAPRRRNNTQDSHKIR